MQIGQPRLLVLAGPPAAGKTTLAREIGGNVVSVGDALARALYAVGHPVAERADVGQRFLEHFTVDDIYEVIRANASDCDTIIDGVRFVRTCEQLRASGPACSIWYVTAEPEIRRSRRLAEWEALNVAKEEAERRWVAYESYTSEHEALCAIADRIIENNDSRPALRRQIEARWRLGTVMHTQ